MIFGNAERVQLWLLWKQAHELVRSAVVADMTAHTGLGEPELTVLTHLHASGGTMRQNALVSSTGWDRTRLSHLLTRCENRGLVSRARLTNGVEVSLRAHGQLLMDQSQSALATAVDAHLTGALADGELTELLGSLNALVARNQPGAAGANWRDAGGSDSSPQK